MKLHVSIPTFNRGPKLRAQLEALRVVKNEVGPQLSISIHDNASTDNTSIVCQDMQQAGLEFDYFVNSRNLGLAKNLRKCIFPCDADYIWILGDDDLIDQQQLISALKNVTPGNSMILFNSIKKGKTISSYFSEDEIDVLNNLNSLCLFQSILLTKSVLTFWISGFWVEQSIALEALSLPVSHDNMMFPLLVSGIASLRGKVKVSEFSLAVHELNNDQWSKRWGKLVMWTDKREIILELVRSGFPWKLVFDSGFAGRISLKQLISLILRWPRHSFRSIAVNTNWPRTSG